MITSTPILPEQRLAYAARPGVSQIDSATHRPSSQAGFAAVLLHR